MKIYTGTGDRGRTSLFSGERVSKDHARVEAYGGVDELNSTLGAMVAVFPAQAVELKAQIQKVQSELFQVGAWLATTSGAPVAQHLMPLDDATRRLEKAIDDLQRDLVPLHHFILPGGHPSAAWAHVARSVCRRTERRVAGLLPQEAPPEELPTQMLQVLTYLNRLSDYLFVLARTLNKVAGVSDTIWEN
jgi:cob(I)alamin adenosyltransferase